MRGVRIDAEPLAMGSSLELVVEERWGSLGISSLDAWAGNSIGPGQGGPEEPEHPIVFSEASSFPERM
jgi:hypothetical protein